MPLKLKVKRLSDKAILPKRATSGSAGYDIASIEVCVVPARGKYIVKTGLSIALPPGVYGRIAPRSGLAAKNDIDVGAGVIDSDFRAEFRVILFNHGDQDFKIAEGDRVAQLILEKIAIAEVEEVEDLDATERGDKGFGSSGVSTPVAAKHAK